MRIFEIGAGGAIIFDGVVLGVKVSFEVVAKLIVKIQ